MTLKVKLLPRTTIKGKVRGTGRDGIDGTDGTDGSIGPQGPPGPIGPQGIQGVPGLSSGIYVNIKDFGAVGNSVTDDTAAINAAYASLLGSSGTVLWPRGNYKVTNTIVCGSATGGADAPTSYIGTYCPSGPVGTILSYAGPTDGRPAFQMAKNKYNRMFGLRLGNLSSRGSSVGMLLGGSGSGSFGNQVLSFGIENCIIGGFHVGVTDGNFGACSEIVWTSLTLEANDIGFTLNDFNSLNHVFYTIQLSDNTVGLDTGAVSEFYVFGGSGTDNGTDFRINQNSQHTLISGYRCERGVLCTGTSQDACVTLESILHADAITPNFDSVVGLFGRLCVRNCTLSGFITVNNPTVRGAMEVNQCTLTRWDTGRQLPIRITEFDTSPIMGAPVLFANNKDANFPPTPIPDYDGLIGYWNDNTGGKIFREPIKTFLPADTTNSGLLPPINPLGVGWQALAHVRQLSEGTTPGTHVSGATAQTPGQNLRVQGKFASSNSLAFTFKRTVTTTGNGSPTVVASAGTFFLPADVGKPLKIPTGSDVGTDWYGWIVEYTDSTHVNVEPCFGFRYPGAVTRSATVGADEPDANYMVAGLCGDASETFWVDSITAAGFTAHSSNATSTATVTCLIVR